MFVSNARQVNVFRINIEVFFRYLFHAVTTIELNENSFVES